MRQLFLVCGLLLANQTLPLCAQQKGGGPKSGIYQFQLRTIDGEKVDLGQYKGKVLLIVNVASECGYTDQYKGLQALHKKYAKDGLAVLAFPCNDFGGQEPDGEAKIKAFARKNYGVEFDLFSKIKIAGNDAEPLYKFLTSKDTNPKHSGEVKWNFEKFIVGRDGGIVTRFASDIEPESDEVVSAVRAALKKD
jgi:glutathione peroxidase